MKKVRIVSLVWDMPTGPLHFYQTLSKYVYGYQSYAQDFGFRGDNYITKKLRVISPAHDMPTGPPLHIYQILSNYLKQYGSYCLHKISASGEITT